MSAIILQDEIVHYEVLGRGRPIIFLHSWVGSWRYWIASMQATSQTFRTYALDFWGFGDSAKEISRYTLGKQVELIEAFVRELGIGKVAFLGHGLGAMISFLFADRHPEKVDRVMAVGMPLNQNVINPRLKEGSPKDLAQWLLDQSPSSISPTIEDSKTDHEAIKRSLEKFSNVKPLSLVRRIRIPSLLVYGQNDLIIQPPLIEDLGTLPNFIHAIIFNNSGHFPMINESSKFHRLAFDFFTLESGQSPKDIKIKQEWKRRIR